MKLVKCSRSEKEASFYRHILSRRKYIESALITEYPTVNLRPNSWNISLLLVQIMVCQVSLKCSIKDQENKKNLNNDMNL